MVQRLLNIAALLTLLAPTTECFHHNEIWTRSTPSNVRRTRRKHYSRHLTATLNPLEDLLQNWNKNFLFPPPSAQRENTIAAKTVNTFIRAVSQKDAMTAISLMTADGVFEDANYFKICTGRDELERRLRLEREALSSDTAVTIVVDDMATEPTKVGVKFHSESAVGVEIANSRGSAFFQLDNTGSSQLEKAPLIQRVFWVTESAQKSGEGDLRLLSNASKLLGATTKKKPTTDTPVPHTGRRMTPPEQYFTAWNQRDMDMAVSVFTDTVTYDDTAFPDPFSGKDNLRRHLFICANAFPPTFTFEVDDLVSAGDRMAVLWHVENNNEPLPFTQGCSFYKLDAAKRKIQDGIDFVDPGPQKFGGAKLLLQSMKTKLTQEPVRFIPIVAWVAYMYIVFLSNDILPGANALQLEQRTWEEVRDLSLNFFLVSPILSLPFSPVVHPMLEGVFNLLLSWAALFAGFLSDDRKDKPNLLPALPIVVGMQFLTSAFLLPYLATRSNENRDDVTRQDLSPAAQLCESPFLGAFMGLVGTNSIAWFLFGRSEFGELNERWSSFVELLSIDRVGSSFVVDLAIFGLFQAWLVDDDIKRRGLSNVSKPLAAIAKLVPFFGMAAYLTLRPSLPSSSDQSQDLTIQ